MRRERWSMQRGWVGWIAATAALLTLGSLSRAQPAASDPLAAILERLAWRNVGPAIMGGRIDDFAVPEGQPGTLYLATASGGLFKTTNNGTTWEALFDGQPVSTIGDVAVATSNPEVVWVGTGEANNRQSSSWGNGVYRSTDGGKTWTHLGLDDTMHIGRIVVDPRSAEVAYVAAAGRLWGPSQARGVFKTTDGGKTWTRALFLDEDTGCIDLALDPQDPETLYAAAYQRRRTAWGFNGGGPGSGIYKTTDGGATWKKLSEGLPAGVTGRIGLDVYRKDGRVLYATVEHPAGGLFRSDDAGESWQRVSETNPRPMYYSQVRIDPNNDQRIWLLGVALYFSSDGGKSFDPAMAQRIHSDFHALWIDPANSDHVVAGCDGGVQRSWDRGRTWDYLNTLPLAQFYEVCFDFQRPYWVYGGLQDNGSWGAPSATPYAQGSTNEDWVRVGGGDGFYVQADPVDPNVLYVESQNGAVARLNRATGERKSIRPRPPVGEPAYRFDWNTPILISPHDRQKLYVGGNRLFISTDRGDSWRRTEDLSTQPDRTRLPIMGALPSQQVLSLNDGQASFGQIVTLSESPLRPGLLYIGTDDGNLQLSRDDGASWQNLAANVSDLPKGTYVSRVVASSHAEGRAYAAFDGHRGNDFKPRLAVTDDFGASWRSLAATLPEGGTVNVVREHPRNPDLLFVGTERGAWLSFDRGGSWRRFGSPLPTVPVDDIQVHPRENDLILATHGRGIWILDDITPLEQASRELGMSNLALFDPRPAVAYRLSQPRGSTGHRFFVAPNPPAGALLQYCLRAKPADGQAVQITILEAGGQRVVRELRDPRPAAGMNRATWDLRYGPPGSPAAGPGARPGGAGGGSGRGGGLPGPRVLPGTYLVRVTVGDESQARLLRVQEDPRLTLSAGDRQAHFNAQLRLYRLLESLAAARRSLQGVQTGLRALQGNPGFAAAPPAVKEAVTALAQRVAGVQSPAPRAAPPGEQGDEAPPTPAAGDRTPESAARQLMGSLDGMTEAPSPAVRQEIDQVGAAIDDLARQARAIQDQALPELNKLLRENMLPEVTATAG